MHCTRCDTKLVADAEFCINCGTRVYEQSNAGAATHHFAPAEVAAKRLFTDERDYPLRRHTTPLHTSGGSTSVLAIMSLVFGILGWTALPMFGALIALVTGLMARHEIRMSAQRIGGDHLAMVGLVLGIANLLFATVLLSAWLLFHFIPLPPFFNL